MTYMLKYDSTHGWFDGTMAVQDSAFVVNGKTICITSERDPANLRRGHIGVKVVVESISLFLTHETAHKHIATGAKRVGITGPPKDFTPTYLVGVNHTAYHGEPIIPSTSCTTNCLAPLAKVVREAFGIMEGLMSSVHATTATRKTVDGPSLKDWRCVRDAAQNSIPSTSCAVKAKGEMYLMLSGKLTGIAYRVPTANVSFVDLTVRLKKPATYAEICVALKTAAEGEMKGIPG
jgi:glyceraldehyde 3-phosphate dehydrogenase